MSNWSDILVVILFDRFLKQTQKRTVQREVQRERERESVCVHVLYREGSRVLASTALALVIA